MLHPVVSSSADPKTFSYNKMVWFDVAHMKTIYSDIQTREDIIIDLLFLIGLLAFVGTLKSQ